MATAGGLAAGALARRALHPLIAHPGLTRHNARGREVQTAGGLVPVAVAGGLVLFSRRGPTLATGIAALVLGGAGLVDDLGGDGPSGSGPRGLSGHLGALRRGQVTTGAVKIAAGAAGGMGAAAVLALRRRPRDIVLDGAVVALAANFGNLLDRAPGRTTKVAAATAAALGGAARLPAGPAAVVGAALTTLPADLGEHWMLGDTGANAVGAALGVALVSGLDRRGRIAALGVLGALTLASERWSFSAVIERTPPLRTLDGLGRLPPSAGSAERPG